MADLPNCKMILAKIKLFLPTSTATMGMGMIEMIIQKKILIC